MLGDFARIKSEKIVPPPTATFTGHVPFQMHVFIYHFPPMTGLLNVDNAQPKKIIVLIGLYVLREGP